VRLSCHLRLLLDKHTGRYGELGLMSLLFGSPLCGKARVNVHQTGGVLWDKSQAGALFGVRQLITGIEPAGAYPASPGATAREGGTCAARPLLQADSGVRTFADDAMAARLRYPTPGRWPSRHCCASAVLAMSKAATVTDHAPANTADSAARPSSARLKSALGR
jgi:hypothetical protein